MDEPVRILVISTNTHEPEEVTPTPIHSIFSDFVHSKP